MAKEKIAANSAAYHNNKNIIREWVNKKTDEEAFCAIHYASFNGNIEICQMLIEEGADKFATNRHGLNCLHIASQGDQPVSLYYFHRVLHLNIKEKDLRGSSPLHWAIFSCSELSMIYILAWLTID